MTLPQLYDMALTIGHKPEADAYPKWGGVWAALKWHDLGATAFDCDVQISSEGTAWAIHWADWWKHGIITKPGQPTVPHVVISQLTDAAIRRLIHRDGWEINTVREVLAASGRLGVVPCLEAKADHRFEQTAVWAQIKADALEVGCPVVAMTIQNYPDVPHAMRRLKAAHDAGIPTLLLTRHAISPEWWMILDGAKGTSGMVGTVPAGKVRLGASSASATKYGCSVMPSTARAATAKVLKLGGKLPPDMTPPAPDPTPEVPPVVAPPSPPYVGPAARHGAANNKPINRVVIHCTVSPCVPGGARNVARMFRTTTRAASAHYVVDPGETVQVVYDSVVAYHAPPNQHALGIELCDMQSGPGDRWSDANHKAMLVRAANLVAGLCRAYGVPIDKIGPADLKAGKRGICGHIDVSHAWGQTSHVDPEATPGFPWASFMDQIRAAAKTPIEEDDMPYSRQELSDLMEAAADKAVQKALGNVADPPYDKGPIKASAALTRILAVVRRTEAQTKAQTKTQAPPTA